jgi:Protein of unknown function (DUF3592)
MASPRGPSFFELARGNFWLLFGGIWAVVGIPFLVIGLVMAVQPSRYQNAEVADGIVLTKLITRDRNNSNVKHVVTYRFTTVDGQTVVEGRASVKRDFWDQLRERGTIKVMYQPRSPGTHRVEGESGDLAMIVIFTLVGLVVGGTGSVMVYKALAGIWQELHLGREGLTAQAEVLEVVPRRITVNDMPLATIRYRYHDHLGRPHEGKTPMMPADEAESWQKGATATVRFDRARPQRSTWMGKT